MACPSVSMETDGEDETGLGLNATRRFGPSVSGAGGSTVQLMERGVGAAAVGTADMLTGPTGAHRTGEPAQAWSTATSPDTVRSAGPEYAATSNSFVSTPCALIRSVTVRSTAYLPGQANRTFATGPVPA